MLHGKTSGAALRLAALITMAGLLNGPALAKTKTTAGTERAEAARLTCIGAFGDRDHFDWVPRMGLENALSVCQYAVGWFPEDADVRFNNAVARDQAAERGGTQQDNIYATTAYRELAAEGMPLAIYALGTMFDEDVGVSREDALRYMTRARSGEFGASVRCEALRTFGLADLDGNGAFYDVTAAESMAYGNYVCAGYLANMFWSGYAAPGDLPLPIGEYARYAAVHGDPASMAMVGLAYAHGGNSTELDAQLRGQFAGQANPERAGAWLVLAYWGTRSAWRPDSHQNFWNYNHMLSPAVAEAMQSTLTELGLYDPETSHGGDSPLQAALDDFAASDVDALFQMVRAKEKYAGALGGREMLHIGTAAMN